jgi:hypothetical protein
VVSRKVGIEIYVEGGGDHDDLKTACRRGFKRFFESAGLVGRLPKVIACGGRDQAYDMFCWAMTHPEPNVRPLLLVDSEGPVSEGPWRHLKQRDNWDKPEGGSDDHVYLMVQCMESWFLADRETLARFFGQGFNEKKLPPLSQGSETIGKEVVYQSLSKATQNCKTKGQYRKGKHSFEILGLLDPIQVSAELPHAKRLLESLAKRSKR